MAYSVKLEEMIDDAVKRWQNVEKKKMFGSVCSLIKGNMAFNIIGSGLYCWHWPFSAADCPLWNAPSYASASDENDDQYDQQQNKYKMAARAACLERIDVCGKLVDLFVRKPVYFRKGVRRGKPVIHKALLKSL